MDAPLATTLRAPQELGDGEKAVLGDILLLAHDHSATVRERRQELLDAIRSAAWNVTDRLRAYETTLAELTAAIVGPALPRTAIIGPLGDDSGRILCLRGAELERFLHPVFVEAGIGEDYVP